MIDAKHFIAKPCLYALTLATAAALMACGGGDDGEDDDVGIARQQLLTTLVRDASKGNAVAANARICVDTNANGACDVTEPCALTNGNGQAMINVAGVNFAVTPLLAVVGTTTTTVLCTTAASICDELKTVTVGTAPVVPPPVVTPPVATTPTVDGKSLYANNCASCHGANPRQNMSKILRATSASATLGAIASNTGGMGYLKTTIGQAEAQAIASFVANPI